MPKKEKPSAIQKTKSPDTIHYQVEASKIKGKYVVRNVFEIKTSNTVGLNGLKSIISNSRQLKETELQAFAKKQGWDYKKPAKSYHLTIKEGKIVSGMVIRNHLKIKDIKPSKD